MRRLLLLAVVFIATPAYAQTTFNSTPPVTAAASGAPVAAAPQPTPGEGEARSLFALAPRQLQIGGRFSSVSGDPARWQRYEDLRDGLLYRRGVDAVMREDDASDLLGKHDVGDGRQCLQGAEEAPAWRSRRDDEPRCAVAERDHRSCASRTARAIASAEGVSAWMHNVSAAPLARRQRAFRCKTPANGAGFLPILEHRADSNPLRPRRFGHGTGA